MSNNAILDPKSSNLNFLTNLEAIWEILPKSIYHALILWMNDYDLILLYTLYTLILWNVLENREDCFPEETIVCFPSLDLRFVVLKKT